MKFTGPIVKLSRRLSLPLTPKAIRFMERRPYPPGEHGPSKRRTTKVSDYKRQLLEKQRLKVHCNVSERQLRNYVRAAVREKENSEEALIRMLETRLDAVVLRAGFARTIYAARQYVLHGPIRVNGIWVNIPSQQVKPKDVVAVQPESQKIAGFKAAREEMVAPPPAYLNRSNEEMTVELAYSPRREEIPVSCTIQLVIEYYSR